MRHYNLCLVGFGNVGRSLAQLLQTKTDELREQYGIEWRITGIATRRLGWLAQPEGLDVATLLAGETIPHITPEPGNVREWLAAAQANVLFEVSSLNTENGQPAIDHLQAALEYGAHAITANKGAVVYAYHFLRDLARAKGKRFMFEASCIGGAPIFSLFRETLPALKLLRFRGILNSTTSVILSEMEAGRSFEGAIQQAQALGIAETDPSADIDGWDATVKVCALANVLMGVPLKLSDIKREGIRDLDSQVVQAGGPFRLVSRIEYRDGQVVASVGPERVELSDPMASLSTTSLLAHFETDILPGLTITAHNPGPVTTAYDLMADFVNAVRGEG